jgi:hypothetical protein
MTHRDRAYIFPSRQSFKPPLLDRAALSPNRPNADELIDPKKLRARLARNAGVRSFPSRALGD